MGPHLYLPAEQQDPDFQNTKNHGFINNFFFFTLLSLTYSTNLCILPTSSPSQAVI